MKQEHWYMAVALLVIAALAGVSWQETRIGERETELALREKVLESALEQIVGLEERLAPTPYVLPLEYMRISSGTGYRMPPLGGVGIDETLHKGIDLSAPEGTPVYSVVAGTVREHWYPPDRDRWQGHPIFGGMITIESPDGFYIIFGHLNATFVHENEWVEMGQIIGEVGSSGLSTASHLHLECVVEPISFLKSR